MAVAAERQDRIGELSRALDNPNVQKYLQMLRSAEGTDKAADPYRVAGGGKVVLPDLNSYQKVPWDFKDLDGKANKSTAAGAYQFLESTWRESANELGLKDFSARSQDLAAVNLLRKNGSLEDVLSGNFQAAISKDNKTWASLPGSPYRQKTRSGDFIASALGISPNSVGGGTQQLALPPAPKYNLPENVFDFGNAGAVAHNQSDIDALTRIQESDYDDNMKGRLAGLYSQLSQPKTTSENLMGDDYPTMFDAELRKLIDSV